MNEETAVRPLGFLVGLAMITVLAAGLAAEAQGATHELEEPVAGNTVFELPQVVGDGPGQEVSVLLDESHLKLAVLTLRQGTVLPPHSAPVPTTIQVLVGEGVIAVDGERIPVSKGSIVTLGAGAEHEVLPKEGSDMSLLVHYLRGGGPMEMHPSEEH